MTAPDSAAATARTRIAIAILLLFVSTLVALDRYGKSRRVLAARAEVLEVARPDEAYAAWQNRGVAGRTLLLFGAFPHLGRTTYTEGAPPQTFVERAALENVVRRVYYLVPDDAWDGLFGRRLLGFFRSAPGLERGLYLHYAVGIPIIATTPSSLPRLEEPPLVYVDERRYDLAFVEALLAEKGIAPDLVVASRGP
jgi:hypothetical protein